MRLRSFFPYFGAKASLALKYPAPEHDTIVEPFAGSACYSLAYSDRRVELVDLDERIVAIWDYLIHVSEKELMSVPVLARGQKPNDLRCSEGARLLVAANGAANGNRQTPTPWYRPPNRMFSDRVITQSKGWGTARRLLCATQLKYIRHWKVRHGSYEQCEKKRATWFVDPPYAVQGKAYDRGSSDIDFVRLATWCRERSGLVIVCENVGAEWLPFVPFRRVKNISKGNGSGKSVEAICVIDNRLMP